MEDGEERDEEDDRLGKEWERKSRKEREELKKTRIEEKKRKRIGKEEGKIDQKMEEYSIIYNSIRYNITPNVKHHTSSEHQ